MCYSLIINLSFLSSSLTRVFFFLQRIKNGMVVIECCRNTGFEQICFPGFSGLAAMIEKKLKHIIPPIPCCFSESSLS